ncbi:MAG TPA: hypothetical protein VM346_11245 [Sphingomicrobium sp.]|jgi:hypothetical protein|nr:hypothetical protein [Sphingomicrobium sp.]
MRDSVDPDRLPAYPLWATLPFTAMTLLIIPVYWVEYGPGNFLWFSDIALFAVAIAMWTGQRMLFSMIALGVLPLELVWTIDILTLGNLIGLAAYMFDDSYPLWLRALSLFHIPLLGVLIWSLLAQGYEPRAFWPQVFLGFTVLPLTRLLTGEEENVNWVYGLGPEAAQIIPDPWYLPAFMIALLVGVYVPTHLLLKRLAARPAASPRASARAT